MCTITATEFKQHFGKYLELGKREQIKVTHRGKVVFTIVPEKQELISKWDQLFGSLPKEAINDSNIERE
ncbi:MAG: type II toxin-antitoxin system Phd/YefM family antitoxin [Bacilli bacterium]|nr:type II toxin-antitoxin system Phd/YefM family antitoxin [Bacilli bacterium]